VEVLTWTHLGVHRKPCALLDVDGYYRPLAAFLDHTVAEGFLTPETRAMLLTGADAGAVLDALAAWEPPPTTRWIDRDET
jgi:predicted Rossmann-fold nucleotide-binding protein